MKELTYLDFLDQSNIKTYIQEIMEVYKLTKEDMCKALGIEGQEYYQFIATKYELMDIKSYIEQGNIRGERFNKYKNGLVKLGLSVEIDKWWRRVFHQYGDVKVYSHPKYVKRDLEKWSGFSVEIFETSPVDILKKGWIIKKVV